MSSDTVLIFLVILNLSMFNLAYRIHLFDDPRETFIFPYEDNAITDEDLYNLINFKPILEKYNCLISCDLQIPLILNQPVRRDTKFLRFGRKR